MADKIEKNLRRAVGKVLEEHQETLQSALVQRVLEVMPAERSEAAAALPAASASDLLKAVAAIHAGTTQKEILRALLTASGGYCARIGLFVIKGGAATGWQGRGLQDDEAVKDFALDVSAGPAAHALENRVVTPGNIAEMDRRFVEQFGGPANEQVLVLPLLLKDKVAALVYADAGADGSMDAAALELLVLATSAWLEVASLRKQAQKEGMGEAAMAAPERAVAAAPVQTVSSFTDPFAGHAPRHAAAASPAAEVVEVAAPAHAAAAAAPAAATDQFAALSPEDADTHRKAQRFARLLVDEIKLYNQAKVAEGRKHKDLYDRLKDDIEKSRATFQKRYGNTVAGQAGYIDQELVRSLAEDDVSIMGANFKR